MVKVLKFIIYTLTKKILHFLIYITPVNYVRIIIVNIFGMKIDKSSFISRKIKIDFWWKIKVGKNCYVNDNVYLDARGGNIDIGNNVDISMEAIIFTLSHNIYCEDFSVKGGDVKIEDRVWICVRSIILPNSVIGVGSVIGANCVFKGSLEKFKLFSGKIEKKLPENRSLNVRK